jgi:hypothetical protein
MSKVILNFFWKNNVAERINTPETIFSSILLRHSLLEYLDFDLQVTDAFQFYGL